MKPFIVLFVASLIAMIIGCDGDGDNSAEPPPEPSDVPDTDPQAILLVEGTLTIAASTTIFEVFSQFSVAQTGTLEASLTWNGLPISLQSRLLHDGTGSKEDGNGGSPLVLFTEVTQSLLALGNNWSFLVSNVSLDDGDDVEYRIMFTPN